MRLVIDKLVVVGRLMYVEVLFRYSSLFKSRKIQELSTILSQEYNIMSATKSGKRKQETKEAETAQKPKLNKSSNDLESLDFSSDAKSKKGEKWNFKIASWNVDGIRAWIKKGGLDYIHFEKPDILCLQETKCVSDKLPAEVKEVEGYHSFWESGEKEGYAGVGMYCKEKPLNIIHGMGVEKQDKEGRLITAEFSDFYIVTSYVPNSGRGLVTLPKRMEWDPELRKFLKQLDSKKPVIFCGDLNVSHQEIDLANPKTNKRNAGFTIEERDGFTDLLKEGFFDSFRKLYPEEKGAYTFWTFMGNCRAKNVGWRLDYFVLSERLEPQLCDNIIRREVFGSDHCPIVLLMHM